MKIMKRTYESPRAYVEEFTPNEYVAACHDWNTVYKFKCDAGGGAEGDVYTSNGTNLTPGRTRYYHACDATHEASTQDEFIQGYYIQNGGNDKTGYWTILGGYRDYEKIPVIIWTEGGTNVHCTTVLDKNEWETAKS